jgi:hypothetical protein
MPHDDGQQVPVVASQEDPLLHAGLLLLCQLPGAGTHLAGTSQQPHGQGGRVCVSGGGGGMTSTSGKDDPIQACKGA